MEDEAAATAEQIYEHLSNALSSDSQVRIPAERALEAAEAEPDFFASLVSIASASEDVADPKCRWLAATCGKNAVTRSWRRYRGGNVTEEEREYVRTVLLGMIGEERREIREQVTIWIGKIARIDFPNDWPDLLTKLMSLLENSKGSTVRHATEVCDAVVKELSSKRLRRDRIQFAAAAPGILRPVLKLFEGHVEVLVQNFHMLKTETINDEIGNSMEIVRRCLKAARRLLMFAYDEIDNSEEAAFLFKKVISLSQIFFAGASYPSGPIAYLSKLAAKLVVRVYEVHPLDMSSLLGSFLELFSAQLSNYSHERSSITTTALAMRFLRNALQTPEYKINRSTILEFSEQAATHGPEAVVSRASSSGSAEIFARALILYYFSGGRVSSMLETILTRVMILSERDLSTWESDPEEWLQEEDFGESGEFSGEGGSSEGMRYEAKELITALVSLDGETVMRTLHGMTQQLPDDPSSLLRRDAIYRTIGAEAEEFASLFNFEELFRAQLAPIFSTPPSSLLLQDVRHRVVMARSAWLIGKFGLAVGFERRTPFYSLLCPLLDFPDKIIALNAVRAIRMLIETIEPGSEEWGHFLIPCVRSVLLLVVHTEDIARKRELLRFLDVAIDKAPVSNAVECLDTVAAALQSLWDTGGDEHGASLESGALALLRLSIIVLMSNIFNKLGAHAMKNNRLRSAAIPIIRYGTLVPANSGELVLMEDSCELWAAFIGASEEYTKELDYMFPRAVDILKEDFDNLKVLVRVIEGYALLGGAQFMRNHGQLVAELLEMPLGKIRDRGTLAICNVVEVLLQLFKRDIVKLLGRLLNSFLNRVMHTRLSHVVSAMYLNLILRASFHGFDVLEEDVFQESEEALVSFLVQSIAKVDVMYLSRRRKLAALALCGIVDRKYDRLAVLERVPSILNVIVQVLAEMSDKPSTRQQRGDFENYVSRRGEVEDEESKVPDGNELSKAIVVTPDVFRRQKLMENDVVTLTDLKLVTRKMMENIQAKDKNLYNAIISNTEKLVLDQLERLLGDGNR